MKYILCAFLFLLSLIVASIALANQGVCKTVCRVDSGGHTICVTRCR